MGWLQPDELKSKFGPAFSEVAAKVEPIVSLLGRQEPEPWAVEQLGWSLGKWWKALCKMLESCKDHETPGVLVRFHKL